MIVDTKEETFPVKLIFGEALIVTANVSLPSTIVSFVTGIEKSTDCAPAAILTLFNAV